MHWEQMIELGWTSEDIQKVNSGTSEAILMQYTGIKDKNGEEIYEGDITNYGVVAYYNDLNWDCGGSPHPGFFFRGGDMTYRDGFFEDIEIIGNVYENPELTPTP